MRGARIGARNIPIAVLHRPEYNKDRPGDPAESGDGDAEAGTGENLGTLKSRFVEYSGAVGFKTKWRAYGNFLCKYWVFAAISSAAGVFSV